MAKPAFNQKKTHFTSKLDLRAKEEISEVLHLERSFVWCGNLDSSETRSDVESFEMWCRRMEKICWTDA
jgi:hypothetical protein